MQLPHWPRGRAAYLATGGVFLGCLASASIVWFLNRADPGDPRLRQYVHARPPVPVVFTSRTEPASLVAAAPEGEVYTYPGQPLWQAREGRLRLLTPEGTVHELTWGKPLPDGGTLIDVMSPCVSFDGTTILFAGRKGGEDPGHFRIYEIGVDGDGLRQITGGPNDEGCTAVPPMRYGREHKRLLDEQTRRRVDYDDVDPCYLPDGRIAFASSRAPDLGRGHARRATNLWAVGPDGRKDKLTANRNNDRWPFLTKSGFMAFSLWSRNLEVITADERDIAPYEPGKPSATLPTNYWLGAGLSPSTFFGGLVKTPVPVWRPRPLFNGRIAFMTELGYDSKTATRDAAGVLQVVQAEAGLMDYVPSARPKDCPLPRHDGSHLFRGPTENEEGRPLSVATPSPCPPDFVLLTAAPVDAGQPAPRPGAYGLYLASDRWPAGTDRSVSAQTVDLQLLFDDPEYVDAEPVAVYPRATGPGSTNASPGRGAPAMPEQQPTVMPAGMEHMGLVTLGSLYTPVNPTVPGQRTDAGQSPIYEASPAGTIASVRFYLSLQDRFDDPQRERVLGEWKLLREVSLNGDAGITTFLPAGGPSVLAGFNKEGRVAKWTTRAVDSKGRRATFYAFAGDHYSAIHVGPRFCAGCHPGHSGPGLPASAHAEQSR
jgi:hypothetical protein